jgi:hypothetical protein
VKSFSRISDFSGPLNEIRLRSPFSACRAAKHYSTIGTASSAFAFFGFTNGHAFAALRKKIAKPFSPELGVIKKLSVFSPYGKEPRGDCEAIQFLFFFLPFVRLLRLCG